MMQSLEDIEASMREQQAASGGPQFKSLEEIEASLVGDGESVCHRLRGHRPHQPAPPVLALALAHPLADRSTKHCVCLSLCPATLSPQPHPADLPNSQRRQNQQQPPLPPPPMPPPQQQQMTQEQMMMMMQQQQQQQQMMMMMQHGNPMVGAVMANPGLQGRRTALHKPIPLQLMSKP